MRVSLQQKMVAFNLPNYDMYFVPLERISHYNFDFLTSLGRVCKRRTNVEVFFHGV